MRSRLRLTPALVLALFVVAAGLFPEAARAEDWATDLPAALAQAKKEQKPLVVDMWQPGCDACMRMSAGPLVAPDIASRLGKCIRVKLDVTNESLKLIAARYQPNMTPTIVYLSSRGAILERTEGFVEPDVLKGKLDGFLANVSKADEELVKLEAARDKDPKGTAPVQALAEFWLAHANWFEAIAPLEALVRKTGDGALPEEKRLALWGQLTRAHATIGHFDEAIKEGEALAAAADTAKNTGALQTAWMLVAFSHESQGKPKIAAKDYDRCIAADPTSNLGRHATEAKKALEEEK